MKRTHHMRAGALITLGLALPFAADAAQGFGFDRGAQTGYFEINVGESEWDAAALDSFSSVGGPLTSTSLDKNCMPRGINAGSELMRYLPIEAAYYGFGKAYAQGTVPAGTGTAPLAVIGIRMLGHCAIDGGAGASYGETEATFNATANEVSCSTCASTSGPSGARGVLSR